MGLAPRPEAVAGSKPVFSMMLSLSFDKRALYRCMQILRQKGLPHSVRRCEHGLGPKTRGSSWFKTGLNSRVTVSPRGGHGSLHFESCGRASKYAELVWHFCFSLMKISKSEACERLLKFVLMNMAGVCSHSIARFQQ